MISKFSADPEKCIRCGECVSDCPVNILVIGDTPPAVAEGRDADCIGCQHCLAVCPTGAVSVLGLSAEMSYPLRGSAVELADIERFLMGRRSVRRYLDENVNPQLIRRLLNTAGYAPSGRNERQVSFTVVDDREVMNQIRCRTMDYLIELAESGSLPEGYDFFTEIAKGWREFRADTIFRWAPHMVIATAPKNGASPAQDAIISLSCFEMLAQARGLGTLWNGMAKMAMSLVPGLYMSLGIPESHLIGFVMSFGKPAVAYARTVQYGNVPLNVVKTLN